MECLTTALLGGIILYFLYYFVTRNYNYFQKRGFPYIGPTSLWEEITELHFKGRGLYNCFLETYDKAKATGLRYVGFSQLNKPQVMIVDPELVNQITIKDFSYFYDRPFPLDERNDPLQATLFSLKGDHWRGIRYKMAPAFTTGKLKAMISQLKYCGDEIVSHIKQAKDVQLNVKKITGSYTLNVVGSVAFGLKVDAHKYIDGESNVFVEMSQKIFRPSYKQFVSLVLSAIHPNLAKLGRFFGFGVIDKDVTEFYTRLVKDTADLRKQQGIKRKDFLQLMLDIKENDENEQGQQPVEEERDENDKELLDNLKSFKQLPSCKFTERLMTAASFGFLSGGTEALATGLEFLLYELAVNPKICKRLQEEIDSVLSDREFDIAAINSMNNVDKAVDETFRKYPPISVVYRTCMEDYNIPGTNDYILKGEEVLIPSCSIQNDPMNYPDPDKFDPERFSDRNNIAKGTYLPFGAGPRFCIGRRLAVINMKVFIAIILRSFDLKLSPKTQQPLKVIKHPFARIVVGGLWIEFIPRN